MLIKDKNIFDGGGEGITCRLSAPLSKFYNVSLAKYVYFLLCGHNLFSNRLYERKYFQRQSVRSGL